MTLEREAFEASAVLSSLFGFFFFVFANASLDSSRTNNRSNQSSRVPPRLANRKRNNLRKHRKRFMRSNRCDYSLLHRGGRKRTLDKLDNYRQDESQGESPSGSVRSRSDRRIFTNEWFCKSDSTKAMRNEFVKSVSVSCTNVRRYL